MKAKPIQLAIVAGAAPQKRLFFNAYSINRDIFPEFVTLQFCTVQASEVLDSFCCVLALEAIESARDNNLTFLNDILDVDKPTSIVIPSFHRPDGFEPVDLMSMARHGSTGEICFRAFSWKAVVDKNRESDTPDPEAYFVAFLRCPAGLLRSFVTELYGNDTTGK